MLETGCGQAVQIRNKIFTQLVSAFQVSSGSLVCELRISDTSTKLSTRPSLLKLHGQTDRQTDHSTPAACTSSMNTTAVVLF